MNVSLEQPPSGKGGNAITPIYHSQTVGGKVLFPFIYVRGKWNCLSLSGNRFILAQNKTAIKDLNASLWHFFLFIFKVVWCSCAIFTESKLGNDGFQKAQITLATAKTSFLRKWGKLPMQKTRRSSMMQWMHWKNFQSGINNKGTTRLVPRNMAETMQGTEHFWLLMFSISVETTRIQRKISKSNNIVAISALLSVTLFSALNTPFWPSWNITM